MMPAGDFFTLSSEQVAQYNRDGFLVVKGFASADEILALKNGAGEILEDFDPNSASIFSTVNQVKASDQYFLDSASKMNCFFEENAFDAEGKLKQAKHLSINKIGHALHDLDPTFKSYSRSQRIQSILKDLGYVKPVPVQSMYIFKQPGIGGEVVAHQDNTFLYTHPPSVLGLWLALEDANLSNGCLWAVPGSHSHPPARRMVLRDGAVTFDAPPSQWDTSAAVPLEVPAGTLVVLHGNLVHLSHENNSPLSRHSYTLHVVEGTREWAPDNWLQRIPELPFEPLYDYSTERSG